MKLYTLAWTIWLPIITTLCGYSDKIGMVQMGVTGVVWAVPQKPLAGGHTQDHSIQLPLQCIHPTTIAMMSSCVFTTQDVIAIYGCGDWSMCM